MSGQIINSYRWTDKPLMAKQIIMGVLLALVVAALSYRFSAKMTEQTHVRAFTQPKSSSTQDQTAKEMAESGILMRSQESTSAYSRASHTGSASRGAAIQERPLFDGMLVTLEVNLDQSLLSASGDSSAEASVLAVPPGDGYQDASGIVGAKLAGTFQANFDTQRMTFQFHELRTPDGRRYKIAGIGFDPDDQSPGVPADYSSGTGLRLLGATLGTAINTAQQLGTVRVLQNQTAQDGIAAQELNQALSQTTNQAGSSMSDAATHDMKNTKAVLSLKAGTHFQVKVRAANGASQ